MKENNWKDILEEFRQNAGINLHFLSEMHLFFSLSSVALQFEYSEGEEGWLNT